MTYPIAPDKYIACGDSTMFNILDDDGTIKRIRVVARPPIQSSELTPPRPQDDGDPPDDPYGVDAYGVAAQAVAEVLGSVDMSETDLDAHLLVTPDTTRLPQAGALLPVPVWRVTLADGHITVVQPEDHRDELSGGVTITVAEPGER
jgi:hypothetical protein